ncbi:MAG: imelysin family protein [Bacteroidota bacterium]
MNLRLPILLLLVSLFLSACQNNNDADKPSFDRTVFLENYASNIFQPAIKDLLNKAQALRKSISTFRENPGVGALQAAQARWDATYRAWLRVSTLNFGPGGTEGLRRTLVEEVALWPVNTEAVEEKITEEAPSVTDSKRNTRGLLAVEYLLFGLGSNEETAAQFTDARFSYLELVADKLMEDLWRLDKAWKGPYAEEFVAKNGTDVKSSTTQMFNELNRSLEGLRDVKFAIPMGLIAGQSKAQPELVEARFSRNSLTYLQLHYQAIVNQWYGKSLTGEDGIGWEEYLSSVPEGPALVQKIKDQFATVEELFNRLPADVSLQDLAEDSPPEIVQLQQALQQLTRYLKGDSSSLLSLAITFSTGDGD